MVSLENEEIWIFGECDTNGKVIGVILELLTKARELAHTLSIKVSIVITSSTYIKENIKILSAYGAEKIYIIKNDTNVLVTEDAYIKCIAGLCMEHTPYIFLFGSTTYGKSISAALASKLNTGLTAECIELSIDKKSKLLKQTRPAMGGNVNATIVCADRRPQMATVKEHIMEIAIPKDEVVTEVIFTDKQADINSKHVQLLRREEISDEKMLNKDIIVAVGRGIESKKNLKYIYEIAEKLNASVGVTRPLVDLGWAEYAQQIGQTGKIVSGKIYLALGISGSLPHMVGIKSSGAIVAVNKDPNAPIFNYANYGIVADLNQFLPKFLIKLKYY